MKTGISVTLDHKCVVWLEKQKGKKSRVINKLILMEMKTEIDDDLNKIWRYCSVCDTSQDHHRRTCSNRGCERFLIQELEEI